MEKFEKQSYALEALDIWLYGDMEKGCNAFYTNDWTRRAFYKSCEISKTFKRCSSRRIEKS